jgi:O-methyltransferase involved in polyketide biosynthesis
MQEIKVHETAYMTATFRDHHVDVSQDVFAYLWSNKKTDEWISRYTKEVSPFEPLTHSLRNRFFLETIQKDVIQNGTEVLLNFGSGFSMYPYLLDKGLTHIEIDQEHVVNHKKRMTNLFVEEGKLPVRDVHFLSADFSTDDVFALYRDIISIARSKKTFILLEGVLFFLSPSATNKLFQLFSQLQKSGDQVGSVSFNQEQSSSSTFKKLLNFFNQDKDAVADFQYQLIEDDFYNQLGDYSLLIKENYLSLSTRFSDVDLNAHKGQVLIENLYLLQKK